MFCCGVCGYSMNVFGSNVWVVVILMVFFRLVRIILMLGLLILMII